MDGNAMNMTSKVIFGLDLSLTSTGISGNGSTFIISTPAKGPERLHLIAEEICETLGMVEYPAVIVEGYSFASRNSQAHSIGELGGVVRVELWRRNIPYITVAPTARAKFATGRGNASKIEVTSAISARTGITWAGGGADDLCDAWILEEMGLVAIGKPRHDWPAVSKAVIESIDWTLLGSSSESN